MQPSSPEPSVHRSGDPGERRGPSGSLTNPQSAFQAIFVFNMLRITFQLCSSNVCSEHVEQFNVYAIKSFSSFLPSSAQRSVHFGLAVQNGAKSPFLVIIN